MPPSSNEEGIYRLPSKRSGSLIISSFCQLGLIFNYLLTNLIINHILSISHLLTVVANLCMADGLWLLDEPLLLFLLILMLLSKSLKGESCELYSLVQKKKLSI